MKTLDEVIKALRCTDPEVDPETKCNDCPYKESHRNELWYVGPSCLDEMFADALHYLKAFAAKRKVLEYKEKHYDEIVESMLKEGQEREARCQAEIARYQEAVKNCEIVENKHKAYELGYIHAMADYEEQKRFWTESQTNPPLTWDELKGMEGMPVWVEERLMIDGKERHDNRWFLVGKVTDKYMDGTDLEAELRYKRCDYAFDFPEHSHWQAYRKERTNEG